MSFPVTNEYLATALSDGVVVGGIKLEHRQVGDLMLPTGKLIACDPVVFPEAEHFEMPLPKGNFPVVLSVARLGEDQRVAFATTRFRTTTPVAWDILTVEGQDASTLKPGSYFGYPVDAGVGCFMDAKAAKELQQLMKGNPEFYEELGAELDKTYVSTWSWMNYKLGDGQQNIVAFSSGYGDGCYASYAGFDSDGEIPVIVTDFGVVKFN